jgi:hypothetical protein
MRVRRVVLFALVTLVAATGIAVVTDVAEAPSAEAAVVKKRLVGMTKNLKVAREVRRGYDRDKFDHWTYKGDGCDTRDLVLIQEARVKPVVTADCDLVGGLWLSYYDGVRTGDPSSFDVDHMVPLAEAWDSGARRWNAGTRRRFANDLRDRRALVAVSATSNRTKSDSDPADWLPRKAARCRYVREYVAVKTRWKLTVDRPEKRTLLRTARSCRNVVVTVRPAKVFLRGSGGTGDSGTADLASYSPVSKYDCPAKAPIKGNESSMIYHVPASPWYDITTPEQCFATTAGAEAAGFRPAQF